MLLFYRTIYAHVVQFTQIWFFHQAYKNSENLQDRTCSCCVVHKVGSFIRSIKIQKTLISAINLQESVLLVVFYLETENVIT